MTSGGHSYSLEEEETFKNLKSDNWFYNQGSPFQVEGKKCEILNLVHDSFHASACAIISRCQYWGLHALILIWLSDVNYSKDRILGGFVPWVRPAPFRQGSWFDYHTLTTVMTESNKMNESQTDKMID